MPAPVTPEGGIGMRKTAAVALALALWVVLGLTTGLLVARHGDGEVLGGPMAGHGDGEVLGGMAGHGDGEVLGALLAMYGH